MSFGGKENRPSQGNNDKFGGLQPGKYAVIFEDMNTGVSDKSGRQYWIMKFKTEEGVKFDHFINCEPSEFKTEEKVYNAIARQMDALMIYDCIGSHDKLESFIQVAIDKTYMLKGKLLEFTIQKWKMDGREGLWGEITGFLDVPNSAIQATVTQSEAVPGVNESDEIPF